MAVVQDPVTGMVHETDDPFGQYGLPWEEKYLPQFNAAQIDINALPQLPHGYDPSMLAMARARSDEAAAAGGTQQMSQMRRVLGQAGLTNSPAAAGYQGQIANMVGNQQASGRRDIEISNMAEANRMALEQSKMLFSAMTQNTNLEQESRSAKFGTAVGNQRANYGEYGNEKAQSTNLLYGTPVVNPGGGPPQTSVTANTIAGAQRGGDIANAQSLGSNG